LLVFETYSCDVFDRGVIFVGLYDVVPVALSGRPGRRRTAAVLRNL